MYIVFIITMNTLTSKTLALKKTVLVVGAGISLPTVKVHLTPKSFFGRDETLQQSYKEFDNIISIWYF